MAQRTKSKRNKSSKKLLKQFSTLSEGSLHSPSLTLCLELVSKLYHRHILLRDGCHQSRRNMQWEEKFDVDNFIPREYETMMVYPLCYIGGPIIFHQERKRSKVSIPRFGTINTFLVSIFRKLHLNVESSIVSLIYTERLLEKRHFSLTPRNWRCIVIASILTASKVWDDLSSWNIEFANLLPILSLSNINKLEGLYLNALQYDLYISSSEYAKYYFALRGLKNTKTEHIPRYYLDTKIAKKRRDRSSGSSESSLAMNESLSRKTRDFEQKSIMNHAKNLKFQSPSSMDPQGDASLLMEEAKYPPMEYSSPVETTSMENRKDSMQSMLSNVNEPQTLTSSSDSNQSADSKSNQSADSKHNDGNAIQPVIKEDEALEAEVQFDIQRSQGLVLKPNKATKQLSKRMPCSMPSKIQTLRPVNG